MKLPTTEDIVVLRELIESTELDPKKDSIEKLLNVIREARGKLDTAESTLMWALSNHGITHSHFLEPTLELIAIKSAQEHARLGRK